QVSMNLTDFEQTPIARVFEFVKREAARYGVMPLSSEIVGLIPKRALEQAAEWFLHLQKPLGRLFQGPLGNQTDNLAAQRHHAVAGGFALDELKNSRDRRLLKVRKVHGNLGQPADLKSRALNKAQPAGGEADGLGNFFCDINVGGVQEHVVSNESLASSHHGCSGGGMAAGVAEIGLPCRIHQNVFPQAFKLSATNIFQILPLGSCGGRFVEINRDLVALPDLFPCFASERDTIFNANAFN